MKFTADAAAFSEAVAWTARFLPQRPAVPVLAAIRLHADADTDQLTLAVYDYDVAAQTTLDTAAEVAVAAPGTVLVSGRLLANVAGQLKTGAVEVIAEDTRVLLRHGRAEFTLLTLPAEDYPTLPDMPPAVGQIDGAFFARATTQTAVAAGHDTTQPLVCAVRLDLHPDKPLRLFATDKYRIAVRTLPTWQPVLQPAPDAVTEAAPEVPDDGSDSDQASQARVSAFVFRPTLLDIAKTLSAPTSLTLGLALDDKGKPTLLGVQNAGRTVVTRLMDNPGMVAVEPHLTAERPVVAEVNTAAFTAAVRRVAVVAERNTPIRLTFTPTIGDNAGGGEGELVLQAGNGTETASRDVLAIHLTGDLPDGPACVAFNPTYLTEALGALDPGVCRLAFVPDAVGYRSALLTDRTDEVDYWHVLMPVRLTA
ncbi:DNA polymerase III subunit beta [Actinomadura kijaniata]|uniref:DNA polymerase III subunit beta n=1 Tax=Actinomadura kijaniata TaxID=46161 RepID=UPI00082D7F8E|nr:DNA polymerase III subunit beta [Actinomadura kijaniata]